MGLKEKRFIDEAKTKWIPHYEADLKGRDKGLTAKYDLDWPTFENSLAALERIQSDGFQELNNALDQIAGDATGREALKGITRIVLRNVPDSAQNGVAIKDGVLTYQAAWGADSRLLKPDLIEAIENAL